MKEKTYVDDIDRSIYDIKDKENDAYKVKAGLTPEIVEKISKEKNDPAWMQQFRLQSLTDLQFHESSGLGTVYRGSGYEQHRNLCPSEIPR